MNKNSKKINILITEDLPKGILNPTYFIINNLYFNIDIDEAQLSQIVFKYFPDSKIDKIIIYANNFTNEIVAINDFQAFSIDMILYFSNEPKFYDIDRERIIEKIFNYTNQSLKQQKKFSHMDIILQILNNRRSFQTKKSIYEKYIKKQRSLFSEILFKFILFIFFVISIFQCFIYQILIKIFKMINYFFKYINYKPFISVQNQLIFKTNLIRYNLQVNLQILHNIKSDYYSVLRSYFQIINIITYFLIDSMLGLVSILVTYRYIKYLFELLKYVTITLNLAFINQRIWILNFKEFFNFNQIFTDWIESFFTIFIQWYKYFTQMNYSIYLLNFLYVSSYLGISFQLLLVIEFATIASFHILVLYKFNAKLYEYSLNSIKKLYYIIKMTRINNLTVPINNKYMRPSIKILGLQCLLIMLCTFPVIVINYVWLVSIIMICKVVLNVIHNIVIVFNKFPLMTIIESIKKPLIYPCYPISQPQISTIRVNIKPQALSIFELIILFVKRTTTYYKQIISISMVKNVFSGKDLMAQENLIEEQQSKKVQIIRAFRNIMKI